MADETKKSTKKAEPRAEVAETEGTKSAAAKPAAKSKATAARAAKSTAKKPAARADAKPAVAAKKAVAQKPVAKPARKPAAKPKAAPAARPSEKPAAKPAAAKAPAKPAREKPAVKTAKAPAEPRPRRAPDARTATVVDGAGKKLDEVKLSPDRFGLRPDVNLLHLAVRAEQAAQRRGTASTKSRGEVVGSTAKLYRQKGTGRARAGSAKSPTRTGGGVAFGPKPRSFEMKINRKAAHKALAMALSDRAETGDIIVARGLELETPSTRVLDDLLITLDIAAPVLVVTEDEPVITKSVRNLWYAEPIEVRRLSVEQVLRARSLLVTEKAFAVLEGRES